MSKAKSGRVQFVAASDHSLLVRFEAQPLPSAGKKKASAARRSLISNDAHQQVRRFLRALELEPLDGVRNLHPAYNSVLVTFDAVKLDHAALEKRLRSSIEHMQRFELPEPRLVEIPVCYGGEFGPDLADVARIHGLTPEQLIHLHSSATYTAYFLGFTPGFAYLGELPEKLQTPRLDHPRRSVPAGSVGIAGSQTGVYPISTPGGWRLLGRTPVAMFQPDRAAMSFLAIGDRVKFVPISPEKFAAMERA